MRRAIGLQYWDKLDHLDPRDEHLAVEVGVNASAEPAQRKSSCVPQFCGRREGFKRSRRFNA